MLGRPGRRFPNRGGLKLLRGVQMRLRLPAFTLFMLSMLLLWFVKPFSCDSLVYTWFGML